MLLLHRYSVEVHSNGKSRNLLNTAPVNMEPGQAYKVRVSGAGQEPLHDTQQEGLAKTPPDVVAMDRDAFMAEEAHVIVKNVISCSFLARRGPNIR